MDKSEAHFFGIGDWGGDTLNGHTWENPGKYDQRGGKTPGPDDYAQRYVARQMKRLAPMVDPDFIINAGDNFYPGGYTANCGPYQATGGDPTGQFWNVFGSQYSGPGLDGKPWFSVLGNHDYGGRSFEAGWDFQIFKTWDSDTWRMPGQYWSQKVQYQGFSVDIFMLESNSWDAHPFGLDPNHNICQDWFETNADCWGLNYYSCPGHFSSAWDASLDMLEEGLRQSTAEWKIVNTHFPGPWVASQSRIQRLHSRYGIDLLFTGHTHYQADGEDNGIPWIISGGGGGVSSDSKPSTDGHDNSYGFIDFKINSHELKYDMHSWGGMDDNADFIIMSSKTLQRHPAQSRRRWSGRTSEDPVFV